MTVKALNDWLVAAELSGSKKQVMNCEQDS